MTSQAPLKIRPPGAKQRLLLGAAALFALCVVCTGSALLADSLGLLQASTPTRAVVQQRGPAIQTPARTPAEEAAATVHPSGTPTSTNTPIPTRTPELTPTPASSPAPSPFTPTAALPVTTPAQCVPPNTERAIARVSKVVDGDTIDVVIDGRAYPVRYIGIDSPETSFQQEPYGEQSRDRNAALVQGKTVLLVKDVSETDRFDRLLRYVFVEDVFVNYELVRQGDAVAAQYPPDIACAEAFQAAQASARQAQIGLWAPAAASTTAPTAETPSPGEPPATQPAGDCSPAYPAVCIPPPPPDLDCGDITARRFQVLPPDPHNFDGDHNGIGCER